jgi:3-oxoacyl-[acyl-carrier protein] reductase
MTTSGAAAVNDFSGDAVVVTGVGRAGQVGESVARAFGTLGATIHCVDRGEQVHERVSELVALGIDAHGHTVDLTDFGATAALAARIAASHHERIAAIAALAGGFAASGPLAGSNHEIFMRQISINLTSAYSTARAFLPYARVAKGAFVFAASAAVLPGGKVAGLAAYAMAKGGLLQLIRVIDQEERDTGVRAYGVAPTSVRTGANVDAMGTEIRYVEREEMADTIVALCGPAFRRASGQVFRLS